MKVLERGGRCRPVASLSQPPPDLCCPAIQLLYVNVGLPLWRLLLSWLDGGPTVNTYSLSCLGRQPLTCSIQSILGTARRARTASNSSN